MKHFRTGDTDGSPIRCSVHLAGVRIDIYVQQKSNQSIGEGGCDTTTTRMTRRRRRRASVRCSHPRFTNTPSAAKTRSTTCTWEI